MRDVPCDDLSLLSISNLDDVSLRQQLSRLESIIEILVDAVYVIDTEGYLVFCNAALAGMTSYTQEELLLGSSRMLYVTDPISFLGTYRQLDSQREMIYPLLEAELVRKNGSRLPVELAVTGFLLDQRLMGRAVVVRDLSDCPKSEAASSHRLRRGSTLALRGWGFNPTLDQGDATRPLGTPA